MEDRAADAVDCGFWAFILYERAGTSDLLRRVGLECWGLGERAVGVCWSYVEDLFLGWCWVGGFEEETGLDDG